MSEVRLTTLQTEALRWAVRDGIRWEARSWTAGVPGENCTLIHGSTVNALLHRGLVNIAPGTKDHPPMAVTTYAGDAWLETSP